MRTNGLAPHDDGLAKYATTLFKKLTLLRHTGQIPLESGELLFVGLAPSLAREGADRIAGNLVLQAPHQIRLDPEIPSDLGSWMSAGRHKFHSLLLELQSKLASCSPHVDHLRGEDHDEIKSVLDCRSSVPRKEGRKCD